MTGQARLSNNTGQMCPPQVICVSLQHTPMAYLYLCYFIRCHFVFLHVWEHCTFHVHFDWKAKWRLHLQSSLFCHIGLEACNKHHPQMAVSMNRQSKYYATLVLWSHYLQLQHETRVKPDYFRAYVCKSSTPVAFIANMPKFWQQEVGTTTGGIHFHCTTLNPTKSSLERATWLVYLALHLVKLVCMLWNSML